MRETRRRVAWNIRRLRVAKGWAIDALASKAQVNASSLSRIERGRMNASIDLLDRIAHALGVSLTELLVEITVQPQPLPGGAKKRRRKS
jgi:transcriptional regulator with XRE-family HTH domain